ncbi:hypothetical protein VHEMI02697 [[Torrubiella] hemipterigena]|uniref:Gfo/Idh/MocA-like oxidoreductase N-terminal domain-containing protein n=1 Tax=[Torrubiella] hemipterigena TaxID=1531966 RepID=A0A0A1SWL6_9HYPO|nr:hypothetical protein VHEMI02697 [[Torrubiella] hemipterigena]
MAIKDTLSKLAKRSSIIPASFGKANGTTNGTTTTNGTNGTTESTSHCGPLEKPATEEAANKTKDSARFIIIGAGSRGYAYANAIHKFTNGVVAAVAEPYKFKRETIGKKFIWGSEEPSEGQSFEAWDEFLEYELARRKRVADGEENVPPGVDGIFICVLDEMHHELVVKLAPLGLSIMCEKPLSTSLKSCIEMYNAVHKNLNSSVFSIGHVLRYSPHNLVLRRLLIDEKAIGNISSATHTEPVGWWHFTHAFVRGNWRNSKTTAPSLLTKSCHDIDFLLWLLCSPEKAGQGEPHLPTTVSSSGGIHFFKKSRKPAAAGDATNCTKCPLGDSGCKYSAKNLYLGPHEESISAGNTKWPINIVVHDIEDYKTIDERKAVMTKALEEDWDETTPEAEVSKRPWYGRCVFETDNNVCDEQFVTITWPEGIKPAKRITFHMVAQTKKICQRFSNFYGDNGEIYADGDKIVVENFTTGETKTYTPEAESAGHGGGDKGLTSQFVKAVDHVKNKGWEAQKAQNEFIGCTLDEVLRSHAMVFAAEDARLNDKVINWQQWWDAEVGAAMETKE